jgi:DNA polymerase-3 subunit beta
MELVVRKTDLLRELQLFQGIVERKNTIPILANVLLEAKDDEVGFLPPTSKSVCGPPARRRSVASLPAAIRGQKALETDVRIDEDKNGVKVAADRLSRMQTLARIFRRCPSRGSSARSS